MNALIFLNGALYCETEDLLRLSELPEGAYVFSIYTKNWYHVRFSGGVPINLSDVPKELRLLQMVLS